MDLERSFTPDFAVVSTVADSAGVIEVRGELDSGTCEELLEAFRATAAEEPRRRLTLDLRNMTFIDSAGIRALIVIERSADEHGISLHVTPPAEPVTDLLRMAGLADRIDFAAPQSTPSARPGGFVDKTELELPRDPHSPARARAEVRECVASRGQSELGNIVLLTSELVTNAVVHPRGVGQTPVGLRVINYGDGLRVEVEDAGDGFEEVQPVIPGAERGRGLLLVERFADRWGRGHVQTESGRRFRVWFEIDWSEREAREVA